MPLFRRPGLRLDAAASCVAGVHIPYGVANETSARPDVGESAVMCARSRYLRGWQRMGTHLASNSCSVQVSVRVWPSVSESGQVGSKGGSRAMILAKSRGCPRSRKVPTTTWSDSVAALALLVGRGAS